MQCIVAHQLETEVVCEKYTFFKYIVYIFILEQNKFIVVTCGETHTRSMCVLTLNRNERTNTVSHLFHLFSNVRELNLRREKKTEIQTESAREHAYQSQTHRKITETRSFNIDCIYENIITHVMLKSLKMEMNVCVCCYVGRNDAK